jgi:predicted small lipoprotein YifL
VSFSSKARLAFTAAALVALAGCGRRGDLEPPSAAVASPPENRHNIELHRTDHKITPPKKDFVLDPLLK